MTPRQVKAMVKYMKANGITWFKHGDVEISLAPAGPLATPITPTPAITEPTDPELLKNDVEAMMPSDGDLLYWSTGSFDTITESRKDDTPR